MRIRVLSHILEIVAQGLDYGKDFAVNNCLRVIEGASVTSDYRRGLSEWIRPVRGMLSFTQGARGGH